MLTSSETSPPPSPIAEDLPCLLCSYNLRTLLPTANCPECNFPIASTRSAFKWHNIDPTYFTQLRVALLLYISTIALSALASLTVVLVLMTGSLDFEFFWLIEIKRHLSTVALWWATSLLAIPPRLNNQPPFPHPITRRIQILNLFLLVATPVVYYLPHLGAVSTFIGLSLNLLQSVLILLVLLWISQVATNLARPKTVRFLKTLAILLPLLQVAYPIAQHLVAILTPPISQPLLHLWLFFNLYAFYGDLILQLVLWLGISAAFITLARVLKIRSTPARLPATPSPPSIASSPTASTSIAESTASFRITPSADSSPTNSPTSTPFPATVRPNAPSVTSSSRASASLADPANPPLTIGSHEASPLSVATMATNAPDSSAFPSSPRSKVSPFDLFIPQPILAPYSQLRRLGRSLKR